jgi:hypothetical protein
VRERVRSAGGRAGVAAASRLPLPLPPLPPPPRVRARLARSFSKKMAAQAVPFEYPLVWEVVVVIVVLHLGAFVRAPKNWPRFRMC